MKVYVYGQMAEGLNHRRIYEYEGVTTSRFDAFQFCYGVGLDGSDYFLYEFDTETGNKTIIFLHEAKHRDLWLEVREWYRTGEYRKQTPTLDGMRAEDV